VRVKRALLEEADPDDLFLIAWTGNYRTDVFFVDDRSTLEDALG